jgi:hypothetical protein
VTNPYKMPETKTDNSIRPPLPDWYSHTPPTIDWAGVSLLSCVAITLFVLALLARGIEKRQKAPQRPADASYYEIGE